MIERVSFCSVCGGKNEKAFPSDGDNRQRDICSVCGHIHYINPINVVGTIPIWQDKVLLCKRNIEPRKGFWTLPAGFMEVGETVREGAARETIEEAGIDFDIGALFAIVDVVRVAQVHWFYLAQMRSEKIQIGWETSEARLFDSSEVPWEQLAFPSIERALRCFFDNAQISNGVLNVTVPTHGVYELDIG